MRNIWLTSDTHFLHSKDFIYGSRGFNNVEEMDETIIEQWNKVVKENDIVYHLGDVMLGGKDQLERGLILVSRLKGLKYLAIGNHDTDNRISAFKESYMFEDIAFGYRLKTGKKSLMLSHYPMLVANYEDPIPIYSIHGHTHSINKWSDVFHAYNVNLDAHNCTPVNLEDLLVDLRKGQNS